MKKNIFDQTGDNQSFELSHSDQASIIGLAKNKSVGTLQNAISMYAENNKELAHGIDDIDTLFPDYKDVYPGAPEVLLRDQGWVDRSRQRLSEDQEEGSRPQREAAQAHH